MTEENRDNDVVRFLSNECVTESTIKAMRAVEEQFNLRVLTSITIYFVKRDGLPIEACIQSAIPEEVKKEEMFWDRTRQAFEDWINDEMKRSGLR